MAKLLTRPTKVVLTGATQGIGRALRDRLLAGGHGVVAIARNVRDLPEAAGLHPVACDLSDADQVREVVAGIAAEHPDMGVIINNAAVQHDQALCAPDLEPTLLDEEVTVNLLAPALIIGALAPVLRARGKPGGIVNVNSGLAIFPKQQAGLYCATKAGLHSLSQSLRYQLAGTRIAVIEAFLPLVDTAMTAGRPCRKRRAAARLHSIVVWSAVMSWDLRWMFGKRGRTLYKTAPHAPSMGRGRRPSRSLRRYLSAQGSLKCDAARSPSFDMMRA